MLTAGTVCLSRHFEVLQINEVIDRSPMLEVVEKKKPRIIVVISCYENCKHILQSRLS